MRFIAAGAIGLLISTSAMAQEYGLTIGFQQNSADVENPEGVSGKIDSKLGFSGGGLVAFELVENLKFRSGLIFNQRHIDYKVTSPDAAEGKYKLKFDYLDVPVNVQYNFNEMFGVYGGMIMGIKASDSADAPAGLDFDPDMESLYPLLNVGVNMIFEDMIGFDLFFERGIGEFATGDDSLSFKDYTTFGARFIYWM